MPKCAYAVRYGTADDTNSVTKGAPKGRVTAATVRRKSRSTTELEKAGAQIWVETTPRGKFRFAKLDGITYYCTQRGDNAYDVSEPPPAGFSECKGQHWA